MSTPGPRVRFGETRKPLSWPLLVAIGAMHVAVFYGLARALAPDLTAEVEHSVVAAFNLNTPPAPAPAPSPPPEPDRVDEGAAGDPGRKATPRAVTAPPPRQVLREDTPLPRTASTGTAIRSGAAAEGEGTGAAGSGDGTGSGHSGTGRGSGLATKPVHISGEISNARDYPVPAGGREARRGHEVIVRVIVGVDGRARDCSIYRPSPDPEADRLTCQLVEQRLGFKPARDIAGNPIAAPFFWRQRWF